jgi:hypothetical protein
MIVLMPLSWRDRVRHATIYVALILALLAPYLVFIQMHGGVVSYFRQASAWADRDRARAPMKWPPLFESSATAAGSSVVVPRSRDPSIA